MDDLERYAIHIHYKVKDDESPGYEQIVSGDSTEYTVQGLHPRTEYEFRVRAVNDVGVSRPSDVMDVTTAEQGTSALTSSGTAALRT